VKDFLAHRRHNILKVNRELGFTDTEEDIAAKSSVKDLSVDEVQNHRHGEIAYSDDELAEHIQKQVANSVWKLHDDDIDDNFYSDVSERANQKSEEKPLVVEQPEDIASQFEIMKKQEDYSPTKPKVKLDEQIKSSSIKRRNTK